METAFGLWVMALALCAVVTAQEQRDVNETVSNMLEFSQDSIEQLIEAQTITVDYNLTLSTSMGFSYDCWLVVTGADRFVGDVIENIETPVACTGTTYGNFTVLAKFIGITSLSFRVYSSESDTIYSDSGYRVSVMRQPRIIDVVFNYMLASFVIFTTIGFGASIDIAVVKEIVKRPIAPAIGAFCQLVVMPLVTFGLACAVAVGTSWKLGLLTVGTCPGGGLSNIFTFLLDGDITLSIAMTLLNTLLTLGTMPMWLAVLGKNFTRGTNLRIPFVSIIIGLSYMLGPVLLGFGISVFRPKWAVVITYVLKPVCVVLIISVYAVGIYANLYVFYIVSPIITTVAFLLPWSGFALGGIVALITCRPWPIVKTIAIETGFQNISVALVLLRTTFPQPEADLAASIPVICGIVTPLPLIVIFFIRLIVQRIRRKLSSADITVDAANLDTKSKEKDETYRNIDSDGTASKKKDVERSPNPAARDSSSTNVEKGERKRMSDDAKEKSSIKTATAKIGRVNLALVEDIEKDQGFTFK